MRVVLRFPILSGLKTYQEFSFGKLEKRYDMEKYKFLVDSIENATGDAFNQEQGMQ